MAIDFTLDNGDIAWKNWLGQFSAKAPGSTSLEAFVRALFAPLKDMSQALSDMLTKRGLATAEGAQLDGIGEIVGQARTVSNSVFLAFFGFSEQAAGTGFSQAPMRRENESYAASTLLNDDDYRALLGLKIAINNGHGTTNEIIQACRTIFNVDNIVVQNQGNAKVSVTIGRFLLAGEILFAEAKSFIPIADGVGLLLFQVDMTHPFGFSNQGYETFGVGVMARLVT